MIRFRDETARKYRPRPPRPHQPGRRRPRHQPVRPRLVALHPGDEDRGAEAGARRSAASTPPSAAPAATRRRAAPRSASSPSARRATAGTRRTSGPNSGRSTTRASSPANRSASSRCRTGPSSTSGNTSSPRRSTSCRSISPPSGRWCTRAGQLIMVDDERMPLAPGEVPEMRRVRFRTLGCYPLTAAIESDAATLAEIVAEMFVARTSERQGRLIDHDEAGVDGDEEARGLFLMAHRPAENEAFAAFLAAARRQEPAALPHLRQRRRRQVDADRPAALRFQAPVRGPARHARVRFAAATAPTAATSISPSSSTASSPSASRASPSTSPIAISPPTAAASSSPTRPATSSTPATWRPAPRPADLAVLLVDAAGGILTQTRRHAYIVSLLGIRHVVLAVNKIDLVGFDEERFDDIRDDFAEFAAPFELRERRRHPDLGPLRRQRHRPEPEHALVRRPDAARAPRDRRRRGRRRPASRSACRCSGSTGPTASFRGYAGTVAVGRRPARRRSRRRAHRPDRARRAHRHHGRRPRRGRMPATRSR